MGQDKNPFIFDGSPQELHSLIRDAVTALGDNAENSGTGEERDAKPTKFSGLISTLPNAVLVFNCEGQLKHYNAAAREIFGPSIEERRDSLFSQTILWRLDQNGKFVLPFNKAFLHQVITKAESLPGEVVTLPTAEKHHFFFANLTLIFGSETTAEGAVLSLTDITPLKKLQQQRENQLKAILSELKTPTTLLQGHAQMLAELQQQAQSPDKSQEHIAAVLSSAAEIERIVARLLAQLKCEGHAPEGS